jgi:YidC/Oxa1 family membrane protein insertase
MSIPFSFLAVPANALVTGLAHLIQAPFGANAAFPSTAVAIVLCTVLVRLLLVPAGYAQFRADRKRTALLGKVADLRKRHVNNSKRLETELNSLYRDEGGGLALGCLPVLVQIPIYAGLYQVFVSPTIAGKANLLLHQTMFGVPLGAHLFAVSGGQVLVFAALIALLAAIGFTSSRLLRPTTAPPAGLMGQAMKVLPYLTAVFALFLPLAASLYLVTSTAWTVAQTVALRHWAG